MQIHIGERYPKEKIKTTLIRLNALKLKVTELRIRCEKLKKLKKEKLDEKRCSRCKKKIMHDKEVVFKDPVGKNKHYYHNHCFEALISYLK
jgi:hypothetical protein